MDRGTIFFSMLSFLTSRIGHLWDLKRKIIVTEKVYLPTVKRFDFFSMLSFDMEQKIEF